MKDYDFNDDMSSWHCGKGVEYDFCKNNPGDDCTGKKVNAGAGTASCHDIGHDNDLTTLYMYPYNPINVGTVTLFKGGSCTDNSARFPANSEVG